jgi:hypothetical protein
MCETRNAHEFNATDPKGEEVVAKGGLPKFYRHCGGALANVMVATQADHCYVWMELREDGLESSDLAQMGAHFKISRGELCRHIVHPTCHYMST